MPSDPTETTLCDAQFVGNRIRWAALVVRWVMPAPPRLWCHPRTEALLGLAKANVQGIAPHLILAAIGVIDLKARRIYSLEAGISGDLVCEPSERLIAS